MINKLPAKKPKDYWNKRAAIFAVVTIVLAWVIGYTINHTPSSNCNDVLKDIDICKSLGGNTFEGVILNDDNTETVVGWAKITEAPGYAGPIRVMVGINTAGELLDVYVVSNNETPIYYERIVDAGFIEGFIGASSISPFKIGEDIDAVTRATVSSRAISNAVREASYSLAETQLGLDVEREADLIKFGAPEITIIGLFIAGYIGANRKIKYWKILRWVSLLTGMIVLGFVYDKSVTVAHFNSLLLGFFPDWRNNLYWFLLMGGLILIATIDNKNPYCQWFCPFGATQECLGAFGGAKVWSPGKKTRMNLKWFQRGLAWSAIVLGLIMRKPWFFSYEIFGTFFSFIGNWAQWIILLVILLLSLFIKRPWCNYLCPIDPIMDLILSTRRWAKQEINKRKRKRALEE